MTIPKFVCFTSNVNMPGRFCKLDKHMEEEELTSDGHLVFISSRQNRGRLVVKIFLLSSSAIDKFISLSYLY